MAGARRTGAGGVAIALGLLAWVAAEASAGTYLVYSCRDDVGSPAPTAESWKADPGGFEASNGCPSQQPLLLRGPTAVVPTGAVASWTYRSGGPRIAGFVAYRSAQLTRHVDQSSNTQQWFRYDLVSGAGDAEVRHESRTPPLHGPFGDPSSPDSDSNRVAVRFTDGAGPQYVHFRLVCDSTSGQACQPGGPAGALQIHRFVAVLEDDRTPRFTSPPSGTLVGSGDVARAGVVSTSFAAEDDESGVHEVAIEIDGVERVRQVVDTNGGRCVEPFTSSKPCRTSASTTVSFDTAQIPDGAHDVRVIVRDATGRDNQLVYGPVRLVTANGSTRGAVNGLGGGDGARIAASFSSKRNRRSLLARAGRTVTVTGRVVNAAGTPIPGAVVQLRGEQLRPGAAVEELLVVRTAGDGSFRFRMKAGPSRRLRVAYKAFVNDAHFAAQAQVTLRTVATPSLAASRRSLSVGQSVTFTGRVPTPVPANGKSYALEAFDRGQWRPVTKPRRTDSKGRFRVRYRFERSRGTVTYPFRVVAPGEETYPFRTRTSRVVRVEVRGR